MSGEESLYLQESNDQVTLELRSMYALHSQLLRRLIAIDDDNFNFPPINWQIASLDLKSYQSVTASYSRNSIWGILDFIDQAGGAFVWMDATTASMICGQSEADVLNENTGFATVERFLNHFSQYFMERWQEVINLDVQVLASTQKPSLDELQDMFPGLNEKTPLYLTAFRLTQSGTQQVGRVVLGLPQAFLVGVLPSLRALGELTFQPSQTDFFHERLQLIESLQFPFVVELGRAEMSLEDLQSLEVGDYLALGTELGDNLSASVAQMTFEVRPGTTTDEKKKAVQITGDRL
jgi:flagellar motor switch protein FliM